jgi:hypothetical protein
MCSNHPTTVKHVGTKSEVYICMLTSVKHMGVSMKHMCSNEKQMFTSVGTSMKHLRGQV